MTDMVVLHRGVAGLRCSSVRLHRDIAALPITPRFRNPKLSSRNHITIVAWKNNEETDHHHIAHPGNRSSRAGDRLGEHGLRFRNGNVRQS